MADVSVNTTSTVSRRLRSAVRAILPPGVDVRIVDDHAPPVELVVNGLPVVAFWIGEGTLGRARDVLRSAEVPADIVVGRRMSAGARAVLSGAGVGWVDESGAAEIAIGTLIVSRTGRPEIATRHERRWTPSVFAVAEAVLCGSPATVSATVASTGLSTGACTNALRFLTDAGLLEAGAARGRGSARHVVDVDAFVDVYAKEVHAAPAPISIHVGVSWQDVVEGLVTVGKVWDAEGTEWVASGGVAAAVMAPMLTSVRSALVFVDADTVPGLEAVVAQVGLAPVEGGRLTLAPFPTTTTRTLSTTVDGLRVAPWPRVFADLQTLGVRGEEAADHLREVAGG